MDTAVGSMHVAEDPAGRWSALIRLAFGMVLAMTTWFSASAVLPQLRDEWGLSAGAGSWLTIAVQLGFVVGAVASAGLNIADLVPPRRLMLLGSIGAATANALLLAASGPASAIPLRFLTGVFLAGVYPPGLKSMATWFQRGRGTALGVMVGALTVGSALPHLVNGLGGARWETVIIATSALTVVGGLVAEFVGRDGPFPFPRARFDPSQARRAFADRGIRLATIGYFGHMWELYAMWAWFAVFFADRLALDGSGSTERAAFATAAVIGVGGLGCWVGGMLGDRWGRSMTTAFAMAISGTSAVLIGVFRDAPVPVVLGIGLVWGFWVVADSAQFSAIVTELADQRYVGTAVTLQLAAGFSLTVVTIWLVPVLRDWLSWRWAFAFLAPGPALGVWAMLRLRHSPQSALIAGGRG
ncbi:MAG: MFS transporter [Acidimicrobiales bacterium]